MAPIRYYIHPHPYIETWNSALVALHHAPNLLFDPPQFMLANRKRREMQSRILSVQLFSQTPSMMHVITPLSAAITLPSCRCYSPLL